MKIGLSGATIMKSALANDIKVAGEAGFGVLEIWSPKLDVALAGGSLAFVKTLVKRAKIGISGISVLENVTFRNPTEYESKVRARCHALCASAMALDAGWVIATSSPTPPGTRPETVREETLKVLGELSRIARQYSNVGLALDFMSVPQSSVQTLADAWTMIQAVDRPNIGLALDTFHFYRSGSHIADIAALDARKIGVVHLCDAEAGAPENLTHDQRALPGQGVIPLAEIVTALRQIGFDGSYVVEMFKPDLWAQDPAQVAAAAFSAAKSVLAG